MVVQSSEKEIIDIHFHADARRAGGDQLPMVEAWMATNGVNRLIVMQYRKTMSENALKKYPNCRFIGHGPGFWAKMKVVDDH